MITTNLRAHGNSRLVMAAQFRQPEPQDLNLVLAYVPFTIADAAS
jgi:hypothetical protein